MLVKTHGTPIEVFKVNTDKHIAMTMEIAEGMFGGDRMWSFFRRTLLRRLNDIKRDGLVALEGIENQPSNTVCTSVSCAVKNSPLQLSNQGCHHA